MPFGDAAAQAHSGARPCASALLRAGGHQRGGCGASQARLCAVTGPRWDFGRVQWQSETRDRATEKTNTQLPDLPMSLKFRFPWVDHSLCSNLLQTDLPVGTRKKCDFFLFFVSGQIEKHSEWSETLF